MRGLFAQCNGNVKASQASSAISDSRTEVRNMGARLTVMLLISLLLHASLSVDATSTCAAAVNPDTGTTIRKILSDSTLWGDDFPALLANIDSWRKSGETKIEIFEHEAVGATPQMNSKQALAAAARLHTLMKQTPRFRTEFETVLKKRAGDVFDHVVPSAQLSRDDISIRVVVVNKRPATQTLYLAPGLTLKQVQERNGPPESVTTRLIDSGDERHPVILTLYSYAQGSIVFAESNITTRGVVERVTLDINKISAGIF
jgi:hypothetical protein